jgi:hypothetical protein
MKNRCTPSYLLSFIKLPPTLYSPARAGFGCFPFVYLRVINAIFILVCTGAHLSHPSLYLYTPC